MGSVSRVVDDIAAPGQVDLILRARDALSTYAEAADLIQIGAYAPGSDPRIDSSRTVVPKVEALIRQKADEPTTRAAAMDGLRTAVGGRS